VPASAPASETASALYLLLLLLLMHASAPLITTPSAPAPIHSPCTSLPPAPTLSPAHAKAHFLFTAATSA
jgi:hypothetical protein